MRRPRTRLVRRGLLALLVVVSAAVVWSFRKPTRPATAPPAAARAEPTTAGQGLVVREGTLVQFDAGNEKLLVKYRAMIGQQGSAVRVEGCEVTKSFSSRGEQAIATITAAQCDYTPQPVTLKLRGQAKVVTTDGFELETEQLDYSASDGRVKSDADVKFRDKGHSGTARGMEYRSEGSELQLKHDVRLQLQDAAGGPAEVEAGSLRSSRAESRIFLEGGVTVRQAARDLRCQKLQLNMNGEFDAVERASAIDDVDLRIVGAAAMPGAPPTAGGGEKRLRCRKLALEFREKGVLAEMTAVNPATLDMLPGPRDPPERRHLESDLIRFRFDDQGRLEAIDAQGGGPMSRRTVATTEPRPGARGGSPRRVESLNLLATVDPTTGAVRSSRFDGNVTFTEGARKAWAQLAEFQDDPGLLKLTGEPRVVDEQGSELRAQTIEMGTRSRSVTATENVRHTIARKGRNTSGPLSGGESTFLLCRKFEYDSSSKTARYRENALMRSGQDEIRAPLIVIEDPGEGRRRLNATGGVTSVLHPRAQKGKTREPAAIDARSKEMAYDEKERRVVYTGDVEIRQGDILTKSPEAVVLLTPDGAAVERMLAGAPVDVRQGTRRAKGDRATYTPADDTLVIVGEKVVLQDADRRLEGRIVTFQSGSDRIRVDGREEVRTEAVLKRKEPPRP